MNIHYFLWFKTLVLVGLGIEVTITQVWQGITLFEEDRRV